MNNNNIYDAHYLQNINNKQPMSNLYAARIFGGLTQQDRMIRDKVKTLDRAVLYSYQAAKVRKIDSNKTVKALINPNKLKPDYDDKIISIRYDYGFSIGDVFEWENTKTHWIIYLQDSTELAYFKGDIRKCSYQVFWENEAGEQKSTYLAIRGPVETKINSIQKSQTTIDTPNYSLSIIMPQNNDTLAYFKRYAKFYLPTANSEMKKICWQVQTVDSISTPGIIEIYAQEYYSNEFLDNVAEGIVDGLIEDPVDPTPNSGITGEAFIKAQKVYEYIYNGEETPNWEIDKNSPIKIISEEGNIIKLKWASNYSGSFDLKCNSSIKTIIVDSLF